MELVLRQKARSAIRCIKTYRSTWTRMPCTTSQKVRSVIRCIKTSYPRLARSPTTRRQKARSTIRCIKTLNTVRADTHVSAVREHGAL